MTQAYWPSKFHTQFRLWRASRAPTDDDLETDIPPFRAMPLISTSPPARLLLGCTVSSAIKKSLISLYPVRHWQIGCPMLASKSGAISYHTSTNPQNWVSGYMLMTKRLPNFHRTDITEFTGQQSNGHSTDISVDQRAAWTEHCCPGGIL
jgi:hypothetical protein